MEEKELILKIKRLKTIKPNQSWVCYSKERILGKEEKSSWISVLEFFPGMIYRHSKMAFASLVIFGFVAGSFGFAQGALPGDPIYVLKRLSEKSKLALVAKEDLPKVQLEFANKRLEELSIIAQTNQVKKIAPAVEEFQANILRAAEGLTKTENLSVKDIVAETKKLEESKQKIESLGVIIGNTENLDNALAGLAEREISDLEQRAVLREQREDLFRIKEDFREGNYSQALENILLLGNLLEN
jgi:hypothetical protein